MEFGDRLRLCVVSSLQLGLLAGRFWYPCDLRISQRISGAMRLLKI